MHVHTCIGYVPRYVPRWAKTCGYRVYLGASGGASGFGLGPIVCLQCLSAVSVYTVISSFSVCFCGSRPIRLCGSSAIGRFRGGSHIVVLSVRSVTPSLQHPLPLPLVGGRRSPAAPKSPNFPSGRSISQDSGLRTLAQSRGPSFSPRLSLYVCIMYVVLYQPCHVVSSLLLFPFGGLFPYCTYSSIRWFSSSFFSSHSFCRAPLLSPSPPGKQSPLCSFPVRLSYILSLLIPSFSSTQPYLRSLLILPGTIHCDPSATIHTPTAYFTCSPTIHDVFCAPPTSQTREPINTEIDCIAPK